MTIRDKYGYPIETIKNRPFISFIRILIHSNIKMTLKYRNEQLN